MRDRVPNHRGQDYYHEASVPLSSGALDAERIKSERAVERYFSGPLLYRELDKFLGDRNRVAGVYKKEVSTPTPIEVRKHLSATIASLYPNRIWMRGDFEHDNCYIGVHETELKPEYVNFVKGKKEPVSVDLLGATQQLVWLMHDVNANMDYFTEALVLEDSNR